MCPSLISSVFSSKSNKVKIFACNANQPSTSTANMYKLLAILFAVIAVALAAPQFLIATSAGHIPYTNGWTDGPNNGIGPVVYNVGVVPQLGVQHLVL